MRKTKLIAVAAGFLAAAGLASAGKIFVNDAPVGTYDDVRINGNGSIQIKSSDFNPDGSGDSGTECTVDQDPDVTGCQEAPWDACEHQRTGFTDTDLSQPGCQEDTSGGGGTGGDTGGSTPPANCDGVSTVGGSWTRDTSILGFSSFPPPSGNWEKFTLKRNEYLALKFTTGNVNTGKVSFDRHTHVSDAKKTVAISQCPGDFANTISSSLCTRTSQSLSIYYNTENPAKSWDCQLEPNRTYYLNIAYGQGSGNNLSNTCPDSRCGGIWTFYN